MQRILRQILLLLEELMNTHIHPTRNALPGKCIILYCILDITQLIIKCVCAHHQTIHVEMLCNRTYPVLQCYFACVIIYLSCFTGDRFLLNKKAWQFQNICMCNQTLITHCLSHVVTHKHLHISSFCSITMNYRQHRHQ